MGVPAAALDRCRAPSRLIRADHPARQSLTSSFGRSMIVKKRLVVVLGLWLVALGAGWISPSQAAPPRSPNGLVINEVFAPNTTYNQQYFELFNTSANPINLTNYFIYNSGGF